VRYFRLAWFACCLPGFACSAAPSSPLSNCARIADDRQRLTCYDSLNMEATHANTPGPAAASPVPARSEADSKAVSPRATARTESQAAAPEAVVTEPGETASGLARHWELEPRHSHETFTFQPHNRNYILFGNYSSSPNREPFTAVAPQDSDLSKTEVKFQLSFKMKLVDDVAETPADLWFGYTQESFWQLYNSKESRPFRETDYQPEFMLVVPVDFSVLGLHARFASLGFVHQSNGRGPSLSRSWNRVYAQLGLERDNFALTGRVWKRINEGSGEDDNPDIIDYMGRGDVTATYRLNDHILSALGRYNFDTHRGAARLGWEFPLSRNVKGYVEAFSGYGASLIDYNHSQKTIGVGLLFSQ